MRDLALGEPAVDFDLTTTATTDEVIRRAREAGFKVALTGVAHGTVTIVIDGRPIETTTLREDVETDGRWAKVTFGRDFATDARRRDFTINALSLSADGIVHDYVAARGPRPSEKTHAENSGWPRSTAETTRPLPHNCRDILRHARVTHPSESPRVARTQAQGLGDLSLCFFRATDKKLAISDEKNGPERYFDPDPTPCSHLAMRLR